MSKKERSKKVRCTLPFEPEVHCSLKMFSASRATTMATIANEAIKIYLTAAGVVFSEADND